MARKRPGGVSIIATMLTIAGVYNVLLGIVSLIAPGSELASEMVQGENSAAIEPTGIMLVGIFLLFTGSINLATGYGLFAMRTWGWWLAVIWCSAAVILNLLGLIFAANAEVGLGFLISFSGVFYLVMFDVKRNFH